MLGKRNQLIGAEMSARMKRPEKQAIYRKRKWVAEQVIGQIKGSLGFSEVTMRGEKFARAQWLLACAVHNIMKAARYVSGIKRSVTREEVMALKRDVRGRVHPLQGHIRLFTLL